ncbi:bacterio-opsin activator domain-containing protein [Natronolimnohabitans innermongolicus]|uniref:PAS/PAC sensor protein n=1 Tax=Natronolimnohabitans innermongolicus JCM 12255 TaxID=1227499 RepID=L9WVH4_9EURY|nr:bacterio-opsin activator domain-containing protein [Natronolimnohabitans innermongolicus]ELY53186.1 PAS/PAC sensor protein [Natronolimnohabitans innermongolicus JCM 12255]
MTSPVPSDSNDDSSPPPTQSGTGTDSGFIAAAFDALPTQIAILEPSGEIVYTNEAWRRFGEENDITEPADTVGVNYLAVCEGSDGENAANAAAGINAVIDGRQEQFSFEYPCHGPDAERWFTMRAIPFAYDGTSYVLVLHLNITDRRRSERRVAEQNAQLETYNRVNTSVRDVIDALLAGETREEITAAACAELADSALFDAAYVLERVPDERGITVETAAGLSDGSAERVASLTAAALLESELETVLDGGEWYVADEPQTTDSLPESIVSVAEREGYESLLVVPIRHRRTVYGALVVNATEPNAFADREPAAFDVLGDAIGYAFNAIENRLILHADAVTELTFEAPAAASLFAELSATLSCAIALEGVVPAENGALRCYVTVSGTSAGTVVDALAGADDVDAVRVVSDRTDDFLLECTLRGGSPLRPIVEYGASVERAHAEAGTLRLTAVVAAGTSVRDVVETVRGTHPDVRLVSKRRAERPLRSVRGFRGELDERLTDRQRDVLESAYYAGYFTQPRESSGTEIAPGLDISGPTFHQHLQAGLEKLTRLAIDSDDRREPER